MSITHQTQTQRALRRLWQAFDEILKPFLQDGLLLAVSGGPDSRALLEAIALWPERLSGKIILATIDHGMRKESFCESKLVAMRAKRLGFNSICEHIYPINFLGEAELRKRRYEMLCSIAKEHNLASLVTAHHKDDNVEGFLLALAGLGGGSMGEGMVAVGKMNEIRLLRPFLSLSKAELMLPLTLLDQTNYAHDSLDEARIGQRAFIRHEILPFLSQLSPNIRERLDIFSKDSLNKNSAIKKMALNLISYSSDEGEVRVRYDDNPAKAIMGEAIKLALKFLCPDKDLRSNKKTLEDLLTKITPQAALDHKVNLFKVNQLKGKVYLFSGAQLTVEENFLILKRV